MQWVEERGQRGGDEVVAEWAGVKGIHVGVLHGFMEAILGRKNECTEGI